MGHFWSRSQRGLLEFNPFLRSMGSAFWVAWITILYSEKAVLGNFSAARTVTSDAFVASTIALAVSLVVLGSLPKVARSLIDRAPAMLGLSVVAAVATLAIGFGGMLPPWAVSVSALVTGAVTALIVLRVGTVYSEMDTRDAVIALGFSLILGVLIFSFAIMLAPSLPPAP